MGHSAPYTHTGTSDTLSDVILDYKVNSELARQKDLRNGGDAMKRIALIEADIPQLVAFLQSLNEDYE